MGYTYYDEDKKKKKKSQDQGSSSRFQMASESPKENKGFFDVMKKNNGYIQNNNGTHTAINRNTTNNVGFFDAMKKNSNFKNNSNAYDEAIELNRKHYDSLHKNDNQNTNNADYSKIAELNRKHYEDRKNSLRSKDEIDVDQVLADNNVKRKGSNVSPKVQGIFDEAFAANDYRSEELKKAEENLNNVSPFDTDKAAYNKAMYDYERAKTNLDLSKNKEKYDAALESKAAELGLTEEEVEQLRRDTEQYNYGGEKLMHSLLGVGVNKLIPAPGVANSIARQANLNYDKQMLEDFDEDALKESIGNRGYQLLVERNRKNEDFAERNQIEKDKALDASANYLSINDNSSGITDALDDTFYASMEEQQNYNYLYNTTYDKAYEEAINSGASEEEAKTMANSKANEEANKYLDTLGLDAKRTAMFAGFSKEYAEEHPILATASSIAFKPLEAIGQIDNALKYIGGNPNDENSLANLPAQMNTTMRGTVRSNIDNPLLKFGYDVGTSMGDMVLSNRLGFGNNNLSLILMGGEAANETYTQLLNEGYTATDAMVMSTVAGGAEIITEKIPMEEIFSADKKGIRQILKSALFEGVEEVESDVINDIADILYSQLSDRGQIKSEIEAYMAKGMSEEDAQYAVFNDHLKQAAYDFGAGAGSGGLANAYHGAVTTAVGMKNTNQLSEEAQKTIANIAVNSKDSKLAKLAEKVVNGTANAYEKYKTVRDTIDENNIGQQIENKLIDEGVSKKEVEEAKAAIVKTIAQVDLTEDEYDIAQTEPVRKVLSDITKGDLDAAYERQLAVNDALKLTKNNVNSTQTQNVTPSTETAENGAENNVETADESKKVVALSNYARNAQQRLGTMPIESLNDIQDVVNDEEGNIQIVTNDGNKVNNPYVKNRALGVVISNATTLFNDGASAKAYIQNFDPAMNLKAYNTITTEMIKAGKADAGTDKSTLISTVKSLQNMGGDVGYYAKKLPASFFNDMYAYGVKEENQRSEVVASDPQRNVVNAIASQFSNSGLNITIEDNNTEYNGKLVGTNNLVLSSHADKALMSVLSHELTHYFKKKTNLYNDYEKAVIDFLKESGQYEGLVEAKKKQGYADNEIDEEIVADAAENFLSDKKVIDRVCKNDKNLANKIISWLNQTIKDLKKLFGSADPRTAEGRIMKNLEKQNLAKYEEIRDLWVNAYEAATKADSSIDFTKEANVIKYSFASYMAQDYNKEELIKGEKLLDEGKSYQYIFKNTGWFRGADGKWRFEISDDDMKVYPRGDAKYLNDKDYQRYKELENKLLYENVSQEEYEGFRDEFDTLFNKYLTKKDLRLDDVITHDKLFKSYPTLRLVRVSFERLNGAKEGFYKPVENKIVVDEKYKMDIKGLKKVLLHEMQHAIQRMESMSPGASVDFYENPLVQVKDTAEYDKYKYLQKEMKSILDHSEDFKNQYEVYDNLLKEFSKTQNESYLDKANKIEEKLYDKYPKLMDRYQDLEFEYMLAKDNLVRKDLASELYYMTAGEIEARDTEDRSELTEEERREKYPTTKTENGVVFSDRLEYEPAEKFSMKQPIEQTKDLIAAHNISEENLLKTLKLGGFPMPPIAVTKPEYNPGSFGTISVLFDRNTIDPKLNKANRGYLGDAWTSTAPNTVKKINQQKLNALHDKLGLSGDYSSTFQKDMKDIVRQFLDNDQVKEKFIKDNGVEIEKKPYTNWHHPRTAEILNILKDSNASSVYSVANNEELKKKLAEAAYPESKLSFVNRGRAKYVEMLEHIDDSAENLNKFLEDKDDAYVRTYMNLYQDIFDIVNDQVRTEWDKNAYREDVNKYINENKEEFRKFIEDAINDADMYEGEYFRKPNVSEVTNNGRRSFEQLHIPYNAENMLKLMLKDKNAIKGWFGGASNLRGAITKEYKSIEDIKKNEGKLNKVQREEVDAKLSELNTIITDIDSAIKAANGWSGWTADQDINETLAKLLKKTTITEDVARSVFAKDETKFAPEIFDKVLELKKGLQELPIQYFESKPERIVNFDEIRTVLIPDNSSAELKEALEKAGIPYEEYKAGDEADRLAKLNSHDEVKFSKKQSEEEVKPSKRDIKRDIREYQNELNKMTPVADINVSIPQNTSRNNILKYLYDKFNKIGHIFYKKGLGTYEITEKDIKKASNYGHFDNAEIAAMELVPDVVEKGIKIKDNKNYDNRGVRSVTFAAPVVVNGKRGNMAVVIKETTRRYYKMHRIITPDGNEYVFDENKKDTAHAGVVKDNSLANAQQQSSFDNSISSSEQNVNDTKESKKSLDDQVKDFREVDRYMPVAESILPLADFLDDYNAIDEGFNIDNAGDIAADIAKGNTTYIDIAKEMYENPYEYAVDDKEAEQIQRIAANAIGAYEEIERAKIEALEKDAGVKYSKKYTDADDDIFFNEDTWENSEAQTSAKNTADILKEGFNDLQKLKEAGKAHFTHADALRLAEKYQREYGTSTGKEYIANNIESIFAYIENNRDNVRYDDMLRVMRDAAMPIVEKQSNELAEYDDFRKYVKDLNIRLNDQQRAEVINTYGSMKTFRKAIGSRINVTDNGQNIDSLWQDICEASGYYLDPDENSNTQILALADALDSMRDIGDNSGMSTSDKAYDLALNIYTDYFKLNGVENITKQMKKQIEDYKAASEKAYKEIINKQKEESKIQLDKLRNELKRLEAEREINAMDRVATADIDRDLDRYRRRILKLQDDIKVGKIWRKHARLKAAESRQKTILRNRIKSIVNDLSKRITNPTEGHHVPVGLVNATIDVLNNIDLNTGKSVNMAEKLRKLSEKYEAIKKGYGEEVNPDYDPNLQKMIDRLGKLFEGRSIAKLSQNELQEVFDICKALQTQIRNMSKFIDSNIKANIYDTGKSIIEDVNATKGVGDGKLANMANSYLTASVNAERFFNRISGYKDDSALNKLYEDLNEGSHKMMQIEFDVSDLMRDVLEGSENQKLADKFKGDNKKDWIETPFKDKNGNTIKVPQSFRASLALHMMNDQNMKHIMYGGLTLPNEKLYQQGKIADAYTRGTVVKLVDTAEMREILKQINNAETIYERDELWKKYNDVKSKAEKAGMTTINSFLADMTPYERAWVESAKKYFHEYSGKKINETSIKLNGYAKAVVDNYFPIKSDPSFTRSDMEGLKLDATIEGWGNLKERVNGSNPIVLEGLDRVLNAHSKMLAKYAGMAIPIRNFNKVYGVTLGGYKDSVKKAIGTKFGARSNKFISDLFTDLQMGRQNGSRLLAGLRGNHAAATLTLNIPVTWSQAASLPTAAAELGHDAILHALGSKAGVNFATEFGSFWRLSRTTKEIMETAEKYTPLLKYRNLGNSTQELGDLKNQRTWLQKNKVTGKVVEKATNWIQNMDVTTVATLWKASEYRVGKDNPSLKPGTDEFYKEVAKVFNKAVERTQPNYTTLQRPDILRSNSELVKLLTMYKTQPMQNLGILIDSTGNLNAKAREYKANPTAENEAKYNKAKKQFARAVSSQVVAACTFVGMRAIANAILHRLNPFRDDDDELTLESIMKRYWEDVGSSLAGSFIGGSELYSYIMAMITKEKWYGIQLSTFDNLTSLGTDLYNIGTKDSLDDKKKYLKKLMKDASLSFGIPLNNMEKLYDAFRLHAEDIKNGEFLSFEAGVDRSKTQNNHRLYEAMKEGNWDKFDKLYSTLDPEKVTKDQGSVTYMIRDDYKAGDISEETAEEYLQEIGFSKDDAHFKVQEWEYDGEESGKSDYKEVFDAIDDFDGSDKSRSSIISAIDEMKDYGYSTDKFNGGKSITDHYREQYIELYNSDKSAAINMKSALATAYQACGLSREKALKKIDGWVKKK